MSICVLHPRAAQGPYGAASERLQLRQANGGCRSNRRKKTRLGTRNGLAINIVDVFDHCRRVRRPLASVSANSIRQSGRRPARHGSNFESRTLLFPLNHPNPSGDLYRILTTLSDLTSLGKLSLNFSLTPQRGTCLGCEEERGARGVFFRKLDPRASRKYGRYRPRNKICHMPAVSHHLDDSLFGCNYTNKG